MLRYAITDRSLFPTASSAHPHQALIARCATLAQQGIDFLLIREKDLPTSTLTHLARQILAAARHANSATRILIANRPDIALAAGLDGVHLSSSPSELTPAQVRTLFRYAGIPDPVITLSGHTLAEVRAARTYTPNAILFAPVFGKSSAGVQVTPPAGLEALRQACLTAAPVSILALGGITHENTPACLEAGAAGIAAIRLFLSPP